ncbi:annexin A7-like [Liolophura sinensis]|uniref:annexin A7-like n=1 Tax=Liolophura sinensis TaxID=3198878 RepID=UPI003158AB68
MSYYQSNYPSYGSPYGAPPPSSGPPPPPGAYHWGQQWTAYSVNQYPQGQAFGYGGYNVPAVQQIHQQNYPCAQETPVQPVAPMPVPVSLSLQAYDQHLHQYQMEMQEQMKMQARQQLQQQQAEIPVDSSTTKDEVDNGTNDEDIKAHLKKIFVEELVRRQGVSGTFDMTEGTVKGTHFYSSDDPVVAFYKTLDGEDKTGKPWDPEADCCYLKNAMDGLGANEDAITHVVATRNNSQRQELKKMYKTAFGKDLIRCLESELSGDYKEAIMACFVHPAVYDAWCVKEAIYGPGTDEKTLIEILMTRTNAQIQELRNAYVDVASPHRKQSQTLIEKDIEDDTSGDFKRLLISASQGNRAAIPRETLEQAVEEVMADEKPTGMYNVNYVKLCDVEKAKRDANNLFKAGEDRWGTDEAMFTRIFATRDYYQLRETWKQYTKLTQRDILNSVDRETSGDYKQGLRAIVMNVRCRPRYFAERLVEAMKGLGTDDRSLIRIIVSRSEIDMEQIKQWFLELTKQTLWRWLKDDCSGDYKKLLQALVGRN